MTASKFRSCYALLTLLTSALTVAAKPCLVFDSTFNLHIFGGTEDVRVGSWDTEPVTTTALTTEGRPPFDGPNVQCFLSQYFNAAYVFNGDASNPTAIHIYSFGESAWSTQEVDANGIDPSTMHVILDRNTNVFFGLNNSTMYRLEMGEQTRANEERSGWGFVGNPPWSQDGQYPDPVIALANNHIHFFNIGESTDAIFVIHFFWYQPDYQTYASENSSPPFPRAPGKAVSFFRSDDDVQTQIAFIPEGGTNTHIVDVIYNTTYVMAPPSDTSRNSLFAAGQTSLVHLAPNGALSYLPFSVESFQTNAEASWTSLALDKELFPGDSIHTGTSTGDRTSTGTGTGTAQVPDSTEDTNNAGSSIYRFSNELLLAGLSLGGLMMTLSAL